MRFSSVLKIVAALVLAVAVALIAASKSLDSADYQAFLAREVGRASGLDLSFSGPTKLKLGLRPQLSFTGLSLSRPGSGLPLLYIDRIEARVALLPLMFRELRIESATLQRPILRPETMPRPGGGLDLIRPADKVPSTRLAVADIVVEDAAIVWRESEPHIDVVRARIRPESVEGGPLSLMAEGRWNGNAFEISGTLGPAAALLDAKPYPLRLKGSASGAVVVVRGQVAEPLAGKGIDLDVKAQGDELAELLKRAGSDLGDRIAAIGPYKLSARLSDAQGSLGLTDIDAVMGRRDSLLLSVKGSARSLTRTAGLDLALVAEADGTGALFRLLGIDPPAAGPVKLAARLSDIDNGWHLAGIKGAIGRNDVAGDLSLVQAGRPRLSGRLALSSLTPAEISLPPALRGTEANPLVPLRPAIPVVDGRILSLDLLPFEALKAFDLDLSLSVARLHLGGMVLSDTTAHLRLDAARLTVGEFSARLGEGSLKGEARVDAAARVPSVALRLAGIGLDFARLGGAGPVTGGRGDLVLDIRSAGASPRVLAGNLEGSLSLVLGQATLSRGGTDLPFQVIAALDADAEEPLLLRCAALNLSVKDGLINADRGIAVETIRTAIMGSGRIDLRTETIDLALAPRGGPGLRLRGMLGAPTPDANGPPVKPSGEAAPCAAVAKSSR
ncbi:AsmA family protein [Magnetospirillum sp. SS-4]|uniref:AsmA family protein n=1 Tax=Magnetospirillum sp. SS-4 TaxID=2681465 RepID=UPI00137DC309|nr:AsmA family protein [Magnetospirillum sp. SS-4]CAA7615538.1 conserved exported hypothetical protein [Magnetospirillum sp. SS-4]